MEIKVTLPVEVSDDEMTALMTIALKNVSAWCRQVEIVKAKKNCPIEEVITHNGTLEFWDKVGCQKIVLNRAALLEGIAQAISEFNEFGMLQEINTFTANKMSGALADNIIQLALFGEIKYDYANNDKPEKKPLMESEEHKTKKTK